MILTGAFLADAAAAVDNKLNVSGGVLSRFALRSTKLAAAAGGADFGGAQQYRPQAGHRDAATVGRRSDEELDFRGARKAPSPNSPASPSSSCSCVYPTTAVGCWWQVGAPVRMFASDPGD